MRENHCLLSLFDFSEILGDIGRFSQVFCIRGGSWYIAHLLLGWDGRWGLEVGAVAIAYEFHGASVGP